MVAKYRRGVTRPRARGRDEPARCSGGPNDDRTRVRRRANRALFIVNVLNDDLKRLWRFRSRTRRFWRAWYRRAMSIQIAALRQFATNLPASIDGLINRCRCPLHIGLLEGINNTIEVLKRMAYSFRDDTYFFLKSALRSPASLKKQKKTGRLIAAPL